jgi:hypothetical protein
MVIEQRLADFEPPPPRALVVGPEAAEIGSRDPHAVRRSAEIYRRAHRLPVDAEYAHRHRTTCAFAPNQRRNVGTIVAEG